MAENLNPHAQMGSPNGGMSNNFSSFTGVITAVNETNRRLRILIDVLCTHSLSQSSQTITNNSSGLIVLSFGTPTNWDINKGMQAQLTLTGNTTLNITNMQPGQYYLLEVIQDTTGGHTITLPTGCKVVNNGGGVLGLSVAPGSIDIVSIYYSGAIFYVMVNKSFT